MTARIVTELQRRVLVIDGAMGTTIHGCGCDLERDFLGKENCTEVLVKTRPELIQDIHERFLLSGADAVETDTFGANPLVLAEFDLQDEAAELNRRAAEIARAACDRHSTSDRPRFVLGSLGPGTKLITLGQTDWDGLYASYRTQAMGLIAGGSDALLIETCQDLLQIKCAINACLDALDASGRTPEQVPIMVSVTVETTGTLLVGSDIGAVMSALRDYPIMSLGLNCATGPAEMTEHLHRLLAHWDRPVSVVPNAGLPELVDGETVYPLGPEPFADAVAHFVDLGVSIVGGCCGTTTDHISALARRVAGKTPVTPDRKQTPRTVSSLYNEVELKQDTSCLLVGERTNANGSRKFKRLLAAEDWDGLVSMAREQTREGSHVIDVCVDYVGRDGVRDMTELISRYVRQVDCPIMLDSTDARVIEAGLKLAGGKCIVNSINLEDGEQRFDDICPLLKRYGAAAVALTIDEDQEAGMAKTADRKLEIAERMHALYTEKWGLDERELIFDPLTFTIATGNEDDRRLALETLDGIERIAARFPNCGIVLGVSNVSFGLKPAARTVLNSVFMHEAMQRGLTAAIVHVSKILPKTKIPDERWDAALDLIYDRRAEGRDPLLEYIALFDDEESATEQVPSEQLTLEEQLQRHIIDGEKRDLEDNLDLAMTKYSPLAIINDHLLAGMRIVGDMFGKGEIQLPFVLQSAEVMKMAVAHLEPHMDKVEGGGKGRIVLATVRGDVHDIGKNLVDIILSNNGYEVINIGIKQPIANIVSAFREHEADAIGLSGLLVKSVGVMEENLHELNELGIDAPILLGGAALTRDYCERSLRTIYGGDVYYGKDAFEGLRIMEYLRDGRRGDLNEEIEARLASRTPRKRAAQQGAGDGAVVTAVATQSSVERDIVVPGVPFLGAQVVDDLDLDEIYPYINTIALFRGQWGFKRGSMAADEYEASIRDKAEPVFEALKASCRDEGILVPRVVYGYFPCQSSGEDLIIYDPEHPDREVERFTFPRQAGRKHLCISDFFRSTDSGERDVIGMSCVTVGDRASERAKELFESDRYTDYLYLHGLGVECAEALAEYWHKRMRAEMGIDADDSADIRGLFQQKYRGSRYSFGYPACPDMSDQEKLFRLLDPGRIGCHLTENWQIDPEQSTSAIVVHHPQAKYFNA
jgi:5-methyltetrahydrofolate--homocysteine methyltransferase